MPGAATKQGQELLKVKPRATLASRVLSNLLRATEFLDLPQVDLMNFRVEYVTPDRKSVV